jgi:hypothetical protein
VRSHQGDSSATTSAPTAWSAVRSFTVSGGTAGVASVSLTRSAGFSGEEIVGDIQLTTPAPPGGAVVELTSAHPGALPVPATVTVPAGVAFTQFRFEFGQVTAPTAATLTAKLGSSTASFPVTVNPSELKEVLLLPSTVTGGTPGGAFVQLSGRAPAGGAQVSLSSSSPLVRLPATVTVPADDFALPISFPTSAVTSDTTVTITAAWNGKSVESPLTLTPQVPVDSLTLDPITTSGSNGSSGRVALAADAGRDVEVSLTSSNPDVARVPASVTIPAGSPHAGFLVQTTAPSARTVVTISASSAGVTKTATLTVEPVGAAPPAAPTLLAPAAAARFAPGQSVPFDWSDVPRAASYRIQVSSSSAFSSTVLDRVVTASGLATSFTAAGDRFWRVRAQDATGTPGAWSAARSLKIKA